ncbi:MAG: hypothetical protein SF070_18520 [Gemmatimonadota bacterium]|nr:hypothetical protein [Gemmatimonadota bacterium]
MPDLQFSTDILARIRAGERRYDERAYLFVLAAIEFLQTRLPARRHVTGAELSWACRDFAVRQFGLLAPQVLGYWGVHRTDDFGRIVFTLVRAGLLSTQPNDREEDFAAVFEFSQAFAEPYAWEGVATLAGPSCPDRA